MKIISAFLISLSILAVAGVAYLGVTAYQAKVRNEAIDGCYQAGRVTFRQLDGAGYEVQSSELPANDTFADCLKIKGIQ